jgi:hypothetical protein
MARDNALLEAKRAEKQRQQSEGVVRIAELEDRMAIDDAGTEEAHPRTQKGVLCIFFSRNSVTNPN